MVAQIGPHIRTMAAVAGWALATPNVYSTEKAVIAAPSLNNRPACKGPGGATGGVLHRTASHRTGRPST